MGPKSPQSAEKQVKTVQIGKLGPKKVNYLISEHMGGCQLGRGG